MLASPLDWPHAEGERMNKFILNGITAIALLASLTVAQISFAQTPTSTVSDLDGPALFKRIHQLKTRLQPSNSEENGFLYMMNTSANLELDLQFYQMMPHDAASTTLHVWVSDANAQLHPEMLGKPSSFPQMWVRYQRGIFVEAGASHVGYPTQFGVDANSHPNLVYDFADKTVTLPE
jgi:hypothetical protein